MKQSIIIEKFKLITDIYMYSQNGEDKFVASYLVERQIMVEPMFVDVGAGDGKYLSNSKHFVEAYGYKALMIEPNKEVFKELKKEYKNVEGVKCVNKAVAGSEFGYSLSDGQHWSLNSLKKSRGKSAPKTNKLTDILKEAKIKKIGIISIDTEGFDTEILAELLSNSKIRPEVIIIEGNDDAERSNQRDLLSGDYKLIRTFDVNQVFIRKDVDSSN